MDSLTCSQATRWTRIGVLAAFALVLGYIETFIPIPIPGVKLGLANIAILLCFIRLDAGAALFVTLIKVLAQGLLFGSPLTFAYSLTGSLLAFAVMALTVRIPGMHPIMVSILGAVSHTAGQMLVAAVLLGTRFVWLAAPVLAVAAVITGAVCGVLAVRIDHAIDSVPTASADAVPSLELADLPEQSSAPVGVLLAAFLVFAVLVIIQGELAPLGAMFLLALLACIILRAKPAVFARGFRAFAVLFLVSAVAAIANNQQGDVLAHVGGIAITAEAAESIAVMGFRLGAVMAASVAVMARVGQQDLLAFTVRTARRLERRGINTQGQLLALNVCLQTLPVLASGVEAQGASGLGRGLVAAIAEAYAQAEQLAVALATTAGEGAA